MKLSLLIPSMRPQQCSQFIESLYDTASLPYNFELLVSVSYDQRNSYPHTAIKHEPGITLSDIYESCYRASTGSHIFLIGDDFISETRDWNAIIADYIRRYDEPRLFWPDDCIFKTHLACLPIVTREVIEAVNYFPMPYARYKMDDTLFDVFPPERRVFMPDVVMRHLNVSFDPDVKGYPVPGGGIYPNLEPYMTNDTKLYRELKSKRDEQRKIIEGMIKNG